jgi:aldehyde:ferredoxin oxidoreductase
VRDEESEQQLLSDYYAFKGWNQDGIPTRETLQRLGLDDVRDDFEANAIWEE